MFLFTQTYCGYSAEKLIYDKKDQREISAQEVATLATLLQVDPSEIATRAGISTPIPQLAADPLSGTDAQQDLQDIKKRLDRLERDVAEILTLLRADRN